MAVAAARYSSVKNIEDVVQYIELSVQRQMLKNYLKMELNNFATK